MSSLPPKAVTGQNFKKWVIDTLNKLIDYLHGARIKPGYGIMVRETPSGTIVELAKKQASPVNNTTGGGTGVAQDISATVSGGTATVTLSGSTSSVEIVGGTSGNVAISENANGQVEIDAFAMTGMPDYSKFSTAEFISVISGQTTKTYAYPVWLVGEAAKATSADMTCDIQIALGNQSISLLSITIGSTTLSGFHVPVFIPIPANTSFTLSASGTYATLNVYALPTV